MRNRFATPPLNTNYQRAVNSDEGDFDRTFAIKALFFIGLHIPLALIFRVNAIFPTVHALLTLMVGLFWLLDSKSSVRLTLVITYITGAELLWRSTNARVFYEYGKYATSLLLILAILKFGLLKKAAKWPIIYFLLLLPSILVMPTFNREDISANLAGPFALALAVIYFSTQMFTMDQLRRALVAVLAPIVGLGSMVAFGILTAEEIYFRSTSNFQTSGDFGPNQVSSILGLGALFAFLLILVLDRRYGFFRTPMIIVSLWLFAQTMLTFSRGGFWATIGALAMGSIFLFRNARSRNIFIFSSLIIFLIGYFVVFPALDRFSGNTIRARFESFDTTNRLEIIRADWLIFQMHPMIGVGPGQSKPLHALTFRYSSAHTEYSRVLAEHGVLGLLSMVILLSASARRFVGKNEPWQKALAVIFTTWALLFFFHSATRLVAPSTLFGLGAAIYSLDQ